jgi:hypothetical protein
MDHQARLIETIDEALERFTARDLVASAEVVDFLLDLRLVALDTSDPLEELLESESEPAGA